MRRTGANSRRVTTRHADPRPPRWRRLTMAEVLEPRAAPGGGLLEILLGVPLLSPLLGSYWADSNPIGSDALPGLAFRSKERLTALTELRQDADALAAVLGEVRNVLAMANAQEDVAERYVEVSRARIDRVADALASADTLELTSRDFLSDLWWVDELFTSLAAARSGGTDVSPVAAANLAPVAADDSFWLAAGATLAVASPGVLAGDFDPNRTALSVSLVSPPQHAASFELRADGSFTYQAQAGYVGADSFTYRASDGQFTDDATALLTVLGDPPVANDDTAYTGPFDPLSQQLTITIDVRLNDTGEGLMVTSVGPASHGTAMLYGYYVRYTPGSTFGFGPGQSPTDSFTYTVRDCHGATAGATVTVNAVAVSGYTVEWQKPDESWQALGDSDASWWQDQLRWTPQWSFDPQYFVGAALLRKPWGAPYGWTQYASGGQQIFTGADVGDWAVKAQVRFGNMPWQTGFTTTQVSEGHRLTEKIASIQWTTHTANPSQAGDVNWVGSDIMHVFPDAPAPHEAARPMVDVLVQLEPHVAGISVAMEWYEIDDPDHDGPIDTTDPPPDQRGVNPADNSITFNDAFLNPPPASDGNGIIRTEFDIGSLQPGNNFRVAAAGHSEHLSLVKPLAPSDEARLFFDKNDNDRFEPAAGDVAMEASTQYKSIRVTPRLIVWRKLHVEVDSMGAVAGNTIHDTSGTVTLNSDGTYNVPLLTGGLDVNRFENGRLQDYQGYIYEIVNNGVANLTVRLSGNPMPPMSDADVWFWDDDYLRDGQDVPMPDTSQLGDAMTEAYVRVLFDVGDNNGDVAFKLNVENAAERRAARDWDSAPQNSAPFWVAYVLGAFQGESGTDNDPDAEDPAITGRTCNPDGGSLIYLEVIKDCSREPPPFDATAKEQDTVVHEVGHAVGRSVVEPVTRWTEGIPSRYREEYLKSIRSAEKPWGP